MACHFTPLFASMSDLPSLIESRNGDVEIIPLHDKKFYNYDEFMHTVVNCIGVYSMTKGNFKRCTCACDMSLLRS